MENDINKVQRRVSYAQPPHLFHNQGKGFVEVAHRVGTDFGKPRVGRGGAYGDYDNDGDLDLLMSTNGGPAVLWENQRDNGNRFLRVKTVGTSSNRDGIGAKVTVQLADGRMWRRVKSGSSYCSQSELPVTFGLGRSDKILSLEVLWPSGSVDKLTNLDPNQRIVIREGEGTGQQVSRPPTPAGRSFRGKTADRLMKTNHQWTRMNTNGDGSLLQNSPGNGFMEARNRF